MSDQVSKQGGRISQSTRKVIAGIVMVLCIVAMFALPFEFLRVGERLVILIGVFSYCAYTLHRRWWAPVIAFVVALVISLYALSGDVFMYEMISEAPHQALPALDVSVIPGGELFKWSTVVEQRTKTEVRTSWVTACFYMPDDGPCVIAAHSWGLEAGKALNITEDSEVLVSGLSHLLARAHAQALSHSEDGFLYVPIMVRVFFEGWQGLDGIGGFIDRVLEACDEVNTGS